MNWLSSRMVLVLFAALGVAACSDSNSSDPAATSTPVYAIGGGVSGLPTGAQLKLLNNGGDELTVTGSGAFAFTAKISTGTGYAVTVGTQPTNSVCTVASGTGVVASGDVVSVQVSCVDTFTVGGTVVGLSSDGSLVLGGGSAGTGTVTANGSFALPTRVAAGGAYAVTVTTQPAGQTCSVADGAGTVGAVVTTVAVTCLYNTQYAYVLNHGSDTITTLGIGATNAVTPATPDFIAQDGPRSIVTNAAGTMAAVANNWGKSISLYRVNGVTGALTALGTPATTGTLHPRSIAMSGSLVFVVATDLVNDNRLLTYRINQVQPGLELTDTKIMPPGGGYSTSVDVNGGGTTVVATVAGPTTGLSTYTIDHANSVLIEAPGSPRTVFTNPQSARFNPDATLLFVASIDNHNVTVYSVAPNGELQEKSSYATGGMAPVAIAIDAIGSRLYVANRDSNNVSAFTINPATGALTPAAGSPFATGSGPESLSVDRSGGLLLVSNRATGTDVAGTVSIFSATQGAVLTHVTGSPFTVGIEPSEIAFGP